MSEMRGSSQGPVPSKVMGVEGDPPLALRRSIDKGMAANSAGRHVNYLEIYKEMCYQPTCSQDCSTQRRSSRENKLDGGSAYPRS